MKNLVRLGEKPRLVLALIFSVTAVLGATSVLAEEKLEYRVVGTTMEGCSCNIPCPCAMKEGGFRHGCQGVGAMMLTSGTYKGADLTGAKIAFAAVPGNWVRLYIDAKEPQREAATAFAKAAFSGFGKIEAAEKASIDLAGQGGRYTLTVDRGKIMRLTTEPVLGGDKSTPITHTNTYIPWSPTLMQGRTVKGTFRDGDRSFSLEGGNSYFNDRMDSSGKI